jgi:membrane protease YdiL (CAAX protease family)
MEIKHRRLRQRLFSSTIGIPNETKTILIVYLAALISGELLTAFQDFTAGLAVHTITLFLLLIHASLISRSDARLSRLLVAMSLAPLLRILSLSLPLWHFTTLEWMGIISIPLVVACIATISALKLRPRDVGLTLGPTRRLPWQILTALAGVPLGFVEFSILRPSPWLNDYGVGNVAIALFALVGATGLAEELIFRGILQRCATDLAGDAGILYVAVVFTALHTSFLSWADLAFVFIVAVLFGAIVKRTGTLTGVIAAHTLVNVMLYLVLPRYL